MKKTLTLTPVLILLLALQVTGKKNTEADILLHRAVQKGNIKGVEEALAKKADINSFSSEKEDGTTALYDAAGRGHYEIAELLVSKGADINLGKRSGENPLEAAVDRGHMILVDFFLSQFKNPDKKMLNRLLETAILGNYPEIIILLIDAGADVNNTNSKGNTPLIYASSVDIELATILVKEGADVKKKSTYGATALFYAANSKIARLLIEMGVEVNARDRYGSTALINAVLAGKPLLVKTLVENKADVNAKNINNRTALMFAQEMQMDSIITILKEAGAEE